MGGFVLLFRSANPNTKLAEDVNSSRDFEDGTWTAATATAVFDGNFGARKKEPAAAADASFQGALERQSGKRN